MRSNAQKTGFKRGKTRTRFVKGIGMSEVSTVLAGARGFKHRPLAPDPQSLLTALHEHDLR